ncbi:MAG: F0F1 ATP synthase subunit B [Gammaproteobacteria bacterium]|nr:F0F1 ATP synthase subunit B [Pseudomonadota bacterium]MCH9662833.1 F0F1 ATP synthase subunit B [Gammaproteobacteria bacterium]
MNINLTLVAQSIAFFVFAGICWRFIWPVVMAAMEERRVRIEQGLIDAEAAKKALADSTRSAAEELDKARGKADGIVRQAREMSASLEQEGRERGQQEATRVLSEGEQEIARLLHTTRDELRTQVAGLVFEGVEKIVGSSADRQLHDKLVDDLIKRL